MLNLPKAYGLILDHLKAAATAVVTWWVRMSDADKRQTRQRVLTIVACAGVFALGGPLIAQRFGDQKAQEAYRADAIVLAQSIATEAAADGQSPVRLVSFTNRISPEALLEQAASSPVISAEDLDFSNEANERLSCEHEGEDIEIGFNAKFLIEMLTNMDSDKIKLTMSAPNKAGVILPVEKDKSEDILMLVMPVMLNQYV